MKRITPAQFHAKMKRIATKRSIHPVSGKLHHYSEHAHMDADALMASVLKQLGYTAGIKVYDAMYKEYSY